MAKTSFSYVSYFNSLSVKVREAYATGRSLFISPYDRMPPTTVPKASVVRMKVWKNQDIAI